MDKKTLALRSKKRFGELWSAYTLTATKDLGDGLCLVAAIMRETDDDGKTWYCADLYKAKRSKFGLLHDNENLRRETFSSLWDAVNYCEMVDLGEAETTNE